MEVFTGVDYLAALTEQYGGNKYYSDRYVFNSQEGNGFGGVFSSLGAMALPVLKKFLPFLKNIGRQAIKGGVSYALGKAGEKATEKVIQKATKKQKRKQPYRYDYNKRSRKI